MFGITNLAKAILDAIDAVSEYNGGKLCHICVPNHSVLTFEEKSIRISMGCNYGFYGYGVKVFQASEKTKNTIFIETSRQQLGFSKSDAYAEIDITSAQIIIRDGFGSILSHCGTIVNDIGDIDVCDLIKF